MKKILLIGLIAFSSLSANCEEHFKDGSYKSERGALLFNEGNERMAKYYLKEAQEDFSYIFENCKGKPFYAAATERLYLITVMLDRF